MRDRFEELMTDPCCASCDCDGLASDIANYLDHKTCDAERCRKIEANPSANPIDANRTSIRAMYEAGPET